MIYYSAASSSLNKKKTELKAILSDGSCFSVKRRVIFLLRNVKCKDYVSCHEVVGTTHLGLICIQRMKSCSLSTTTTKMEKAITKFSSHVFKSPTFKGSNDS